MQPSSQSDLSSDVARRMNALQPPPSGPPVQPSPSDLSPTDMDSPSEASSSEHPTPTNVRPNKRSAPAETGTLSPKKKPREDHLQAHLENMKNDSLGILRYSAGIMEGLASGDQGLLKEWIAFASLEPEAQLASSYDKAEAIIGHTPYIPPKLLSLETLLLVAYMAKLCLRWHELHKLTEPPPSSYGKRSVWPVRQQQGEPTLCLRPPSHAGLPLRTLHQVFHTFQKHVESHNPATTPAADLSASLLCETMGLPYASELARRAAFIQALPVFPQDFWTTEYPILSTADGECSGRADMAKIAKKTQTGIFIEVKNEPCSADSDPYMQNVGNYRIHIRQVKAKANTGGRSCARFLAAGAPMFLVCVVGPWLSICGGFCDDSKVYVEPLTDPVFMLMDHTGRRERRLAVLLTALKRGIDDLLEDQFPMDSQIFPSSTPRLYQSWTPFGSTAEGELCFQRPLTPGELVGAFRSSPIFLGTLEQSAGSLSVVIKMVKTRYGTEVHRFLAEKKLAPELYGISCLEGAPTAYIMEHLPSCWVQLNTLYLKPYYCRQAPDIYSALKSIVALLQQQAYVHGDLRTNNIMVDDDSLQQGTVSLKIVDFDWSGEGGKVTYPATRNSEVEWLGVPGGPIQLGDDSLLVEQWWTSCKALGANLSDLPSSLPSGLPSDLLTGLPSDLLTGLPSDLLSDPLFTRGAFLPSA